MFPVWLILGLLLVLVGIFNRRVLSFFGMKPMSDVFVNPGLARSRRLIEKMGQWLVIILGMSFLVQGLGEALPNQLSSIISSFLLGLGALMILVMIGITVIKSRIK